MERAEPLEITHGSRGAVDHPVAAATVLGGVQRQHLWRSNQAPQAIHRGNGEPVMPMHDVERLPVEGLGLAHPFRGGFAHASDVRQEVRVGIEGAAVVVHALDPCIARLPFAHAGEDMNVVARSHERLGERRDVSGKAPHRDRVHRLP